LTVSRALMVPSPSGYSRVTLTRFRGLVDMVFFL
jgi:hypothetical protein